MKPIHHHPSSKHIFSSSCFLVCFCSVCNVIMLMKILASLQHFLFIRWSENDRSLELSYTFIVWVITDENTQRKMDELGKLQHHGRHLFTVRKHALHEAQDSNGNGFLSINSSTSYEVAHGSPWRSFLVTFFVNFRL